ncbi:MAG: bifunctional hydroxymethylpyrimidine kinase/phosphomethylpyrimidine kinase [Pikeienuella sp.]
MSTPIALTIAGSDSGGGAGIQADLKAFSALGAYGASVITAITAQNTRAVTAVQEIDTDVIAAQIDAVLSDLNVAAIKIGMLSSPDIITTVAAGLKTFSGPIVLDPVMIAKSGDALLRDEAVSALISDLLPLATLLTPNLPEAARLLNAAPATDNATMQAQGQALLALGPDAVLMKGGHADGATCTDYLITDTAPIALTAERINTKNTHGTGCTLSSSITAGLAKGMELEQATRAAHTYLHNAILAADTLTIGSGHGPVHHFHAQWSANG